MNKNLKKVTMKDRYGNSVSFEMHNLMQGITEAQVPPMQDIPAYDHPGDPKGTDTVPAWLTPGEFVMNAEATRMYEPQIKAMNDHGREVQRQQGGTIPEEEEERFLNIEGGGGTNKYGTGYGGSASLNIPVTDNLMLSPYISGGGFKPNDGPHRGSIGQYGIGASYRFDKGGNVPPATMPEPGAYLPDWVRKYALEQEKKTKHKADGGMIQGKDFQRYADALRFAESTNRMYDKQGNILKSHDGALGMMQVMPITAAQPGGWTKSIFQMADDRNKEIGEQYYTYDPVIAKEKVKDKNGKLIPSPAAQAEAAKLLSRPELNLQYGDNLLMDMGKRQKGELDVTAASYNSGLGGGNKYRRAAEAGDFSTLPQWMQDETVPYVDKIMARYLNPQGNYNAVHREEGSVNPEVPPIDGIVNDMNGFVETNPYHVPPTDTPDSVRQRMLDEGELLESGLYPIALDDIYQSAHFPDNRDFSGMYPDQESWDRRMDQEIDRIDSQFADIDGRTQAERVAPYPDEYGTDDSETTMTEQDKALIQAGKERRLQEEKDRLSDQIQSGVPVTPEQKANLITLENKANNVPVVPVDSKVPPVPEAPPAITPAPIINEGDYMDKAVDDFRANEAIKYFGNETVTSMVNWLKDKGNNLLDRVLDSPALSEDALWGYALNYLGSRALGYDHDASATYAGKQHAAYVNDLNKNVTAAINSGKYTKESIQKYKKTGKLLDLERSRDVGSSIQGIQTKDGKLVQAQWDSVRDAWVTKNNATGKWEEVQGTPVDLKANVTAIKDARKAQSKAYENMRKSVAEKTKQLFTQKENDKTSKLLPRPSSNASTAHSYFTSRGFPLDNMNVRQNAEVMTDMAMDMMYEQARITGEKVYSIEPYLVLAQAKMTVGTDLGFWQTESGADMDANKVQKMVKELNRAAENGIVKHKDIDGDGKIELWETQKTTNAFLKQQALLFQKAKQEGKTNVSVGDGESEFYAYLMEKMKAAQKAAADKANKK